MESPEEYAILSDDDSDVKPWKENDLEMSLEEVPLIWDSSICGETEDKNVDFQIQKLELLKSSSAEKGELYLLAPTQKTTPIILYPPKVETPGTPPRKKSKSVTFASPCYETKSFSKDYYENEADYFKDWKPNFKIAHVESLALPVKELFKTSDDMKIKSALKPFATLPILDRGFTIKHPELSPLKLQSVKSYDTNEHNLTPIKSPGSPQPPVLSPQLPLASLRNSATKVFSTHCRKLGATKPNGDLSDLDRYFINPTKLISLEKYYYAEFPGNERTGEPFNKFLKCPICAKQFTSNIDIYCHIYNHIVAIGIRVSAITSCQYCLDSVLPSELKSHVNKVHKMVRGEEFSCRICELSFRGKQELIVHMWGNHCQQDMPYVCHICDYRSSFKYQVIEHFNKEHESYANVLCVLCMKVLPAETDAHLALISSHIQDHQLTNGKHCSQCSLVFIDDADRNAHLQLGAHTSKQMPKDSRKVIKYAEPTVKLIKMPNPPPQFLSDERRITRISSKSDSSVRKTNLARKKLNFLAKSRPITVPLPKMIFNVANETCMECGTSIKRLHHFPGLMLCRKCSFTTCCKTSMDRHDTCFHRLAGLKKTRGSQGSIHVKHSELFDSPYFCSCGFKSINPNRLARHLALCDKRTAGPQGQ